MNTHTLILRLAISTLTAFCLFVQVNSAFASGTSTADLMALAERGSAIAQRTLGERFAVGLDGAARDMGQAIVWWQKAADKGDSMSQYNLGLVYLRGAGALQDMVQAHMWFSLAEASGNETISGQQGKKLAESDRKAVEAKMTPGQVEEARALAQEWLAKHR